MCQCRGISRGSIILQWAPISFRFSICWDWAHGQIIWWVGRGKAEFEYLNRTFSSCDLNQVRLPDQCRCIAWPCNVQVEFMSLRLTPSFSHKHGRILKGLLERPSDTNPSSRVSSMPINFHAFSIPFRYPTNLIESCRASVHGLLRPEIPVSAIPTRHECLSILLDFARQTPHRGGTTPTSYIKWWSCVFREWIGPLAIKWSAMVSSNFFYSTLLFTSVWKVEGRICSRRLGQSLSTLDSTKHNCLSLFFYTLNDPFTLHFSSLSFSVFSVIPEKGISKLHFRGTFAERRDLIDKHPYKSDIRTCITISR